MELAAAQAAPALSFFDKGLAVAVIAFCGCAAVCLARRWFRQMDEQAERDVRHIEVMEKISTDHSGTVTGLIEKHHSQIIEIHEGNARDRGDMVAILQSLTTSLEALRASMAATKAHARG